MNHNNEHFISLIFLSCAVTHLTTSESSEVSKSKALFKAYHLEVYLIWILSKTVLLQAFLCCICLLHFITQLNQHN